MRSTNRDHVAAGRATDLFDRAYAVGSRDSLGSDTSFTTTSLRQTGASSWSQVPSC